MKIRYKNDIDDIVAFSRFYMGTSPWWKREAVKNILWGSFILFIVIASPAVTSPHWGFLLAGSICAALIIMAGYLGLGRSQTKATREAFSRGRNRMLFDEHELEITEEGISNRSSVSEGKLAWAGIEKIESNQDYTFVFVSAMSAYMIPRSKVTQGDYDSFVRLLRETFKKNCA